MEVRGVHRQRQHRQGEAVTCHLCVDAKSDPASSQFRPGCDSCQARAIALVGDRQALLQDPLPAEQRQILEHVFGAAWSDHLQLVRGWISAIRQAEARA